MRGTGEGTTIEGGRPQASALLTAGNAGSGGRRPLDLEQLTARVDRLVAGQAYGLTLQGVHFVAIGQQQQIGDMGIADQRITWLGNRETRAALGNSREPFLFEWRVLLIEGGEQRHAVQLQEAKIEQQLLIGVQSLRNQLLEHAQAKVTQEQARSAEREQRLAEQ
ncbi:hypothetical protein D9M71_193500 [compost metagenome]